MPATVTLATTTLTSTLGAGDTRIQVASTSGIMPGTFLYLDGELVLVVGLDLDPWLRVKRGVEGSSSIPHASSVTVYIGRGDQFYGSDPIGRPPAVIPVSPYINVINGAVWLAQGDTIPSGTANRWWQRQATTYGTAAMGVRTATLDPASST